MSALCGEGRVWIGLDDVMGNGGVGDGCIGMNFRWRGGNVGHGGGAVMRHPAY